MYVYVYVCICICIRTLPKTKFHEIKYINLIYIYILLYDSSILDIEHSPYYIALDSTQTHKVV